MNEAITVMYWACFAAYPFVMGYWLRQTDELKDVFKDSDLFMLVFGLWAFAPFGFLLVFLSFCRELDIRSRPNDEE